MASSKGVTGLLEWTIILAATVVLLAPSAAAQSCPDMFTATNAQIGGYQKTVLVETTLDETTPVGTELYTLSWEDDCVEPPLITDDTFNKYFTVNDTEDCMWIVSVKGSLVGVPDYPNNTEEADIRTSVEFVGFSNPTYGACEVTLSHGIKDKNTQYPQPEKDTYTLDIAEDLSVNYTIADFNITVHDKDGSPPWNRFSVKVNTGCPLEATQKVYTSGQSPRQVEFKLNEKVDYETSPTITCNVTFVDGGMPPLADSATVIITVVDMNDEPPIFTYSYYYSEVLSVVDDGKPLDIYPSEIHATDGDTGRNEPITYTMTNANADVPGTDYFTINETTGEVTLIKYLDDEFLSNERALFFVQAVEDTGGQAQVVLEVMLPWVNLVCGGFHFEQAVYVAEILRNSTGDVVRVVAVSNYTENATYALRGSDSEHFLIDSRTGMISVKKPDPPPVGLYEFEAVATIVGVPSEEATTKVTIHVLPMSLDEVAINNSVIRASIPEGDDEQELSSIPLSDEAQIVCVVQAEPDNTLKDRFTVEQKSKTEWTLKKTGDLDYEQVKEVTLLLKAYTTDAPDSCENVSQEIPTSLLKSEALALITVININDEAPAFSSDGVVAAYPTNEALQRAAGPVVSVQAHDDDSTDITYSLAGDNAAKFTVDEVTGDVYAVEGTTCDPQCVFVVKASDGDSNDQVNVKVLPLDTGHVFTIAMPNTALSEVDGKLEDLSDEAGAQISALYVSPTEAASGKGRARYRRDTTMNLLVHVYSIRDGDLMSREELNSALSETSSQLQAEEFLDADVFEGVEPEDTTGLKVAVGVLGGLLGIVLIAGVGFFVYKRKKSKAAPIKERAPTPISILGQAYQNDAYTPDAGRSQVNLGSGSLGHKSNGSLNGYPGGGSLNGYTSAEVHRHQDSPPLHRSPLAPPTDTIPLRPRDSQQQGGLKRTDAGAPQYYGSSSPNPPPSFSSTSPSYPIYAEVTKPKKSSSTENKSKHISDDEEEPIDNKFSSARHSPPPRRSNKEDNDDDDDVGGDVAYPGGKHASFTEEPAEEEKKSVAFKVKVETKEIEAENMGPAQKKAEAAKRMEENRKKIQEEGEDEDEEEEESMKL